MQLWIYPHLLQESLRFRWYNVIVIDALLQKTIAQAYTGIGSLESFHNRRIYDVFHIHYFQQIGNDDLYEFCGAKYSVPII